MERKIFRTSGLTWTRDSCLGGSPTERNRKTTSTPKRVDSNASWMLFLSRRTASRISRLILFRRTAFPARRGTEIPYLRNPPSRSLTTNVPRRSAVETLRPPCVTCAKEPRPRRTPPLAKSLPESSALVAHRKFVSPFCAPACKNPAAVLGCHPCAKAVRVSTFPIVRLEGAFH